MEPNHAAGEMSPAFHADLIQLREDVKLKHSECIECIRDCTEHVERMILGVRDDIATFNVEIKVIKQEVAAIRLDIATLNKELKQEFATLGRDFTMQDEDIHARLSQIFNIITRPVAPSPASQLQNQPPPRRCEASASQPESVNRIVKRKGNPEVKGIEAGNVSLPQTPVNDEVVIFGATNGEWYGCPKEGWCYRGDNARGFIVSIPKVCGYEGLVEKLCEELGIDRRLHDLDLTASFNDKFPPVPIKKDKDVKCLISLCGKDRCNALCVNTKTKNMKWT